MVNGLYFSLNIIYAKQRHFMDVSFLCLLLFCAVVTYINILMLTVYSLVPSPTPSFSSLAVRYCTASDEKLGVGLGRGYTVYILTLTQP